MSLVIVALPAAEERVWKISSEKKPHLTLLFLGDNEESADLEQIMLFVQHATQLCEHGSFYLDVDERGTLGEDEADVLFFNKRSWNLKWIKEFRSQLLQNPAIKTAYDSAEQYDEWTPHLTLGYPETPAKPIPDDWPDRPFYGIEFDRIAVWTGDYEGPGIQT
jgi:2'-5' RNA ligase